MGKHNNTGSSIQLSKPLTKTKTYVVGIEVEARNSVHAARVVEQMLSDGDLYFVFNIKNGEMKVIDLKEENHKGRRHDNGDL